MGFEIEFVEQAARYRDLHGFTATRMAAAAVRPVTTPEALAWRTLLQQQFAGVIKQKQGKSAVQYTCSVVGIRLGDKSDLVVVPIDEDELLALR